MLETDWVCWVWLGGGGDEGDWLATKEEMRLRSERVKRSGCAYKYNV